MAMTMAARAATGARRARGSRALDRSCCAMSAACCSTTRSGQSRIYTDESTIDRSSPESGGRSVSGYPRAHRPPTSMHAHVCSSWHHGWHPRRPLRSAGAVQRPRPGTFGITPSPRAHQWLARGWWQRAASAGTCYRAAWLGVRHHQRTAHLQKDKSVSTAAVAACTAHRRLDGS